MSAQGPALHVTNGDSAVATLKHLGLEGDCAAWSDVLHEGPVPALPPAALRATREAFLHAQGWHDADLGARDAAFDAAERLVLWFERDLYDDLQVAQIADRLDGRPVTAVLLTDGYVSNLDHLPEPQPFDPAPWAELWRAFTTPDPEGLTHQRVLEQLPWTIDGLNRSERALLHAAAGHRSRHEVFVAAQEQEERQFLGDTWAFSYLDRLQEGGLLDAADRPTGKTTWLDRPGYLYGGFEPGHAASMRPMSSRAPSLARGSLRLPHFGDCTHEGQPFSHGHSEISRCASSTSASNA
jgi:hypothetical protein